MNEGIEYETELLKKRIKSKEGILSTLKANKFYLIEKTIEQKEKELSNLKGQLDTILRLRQRGYK